MVIFDGNKNDEVTTAVGVNVNVDDLSVLLLARLLLEAEFWLLLDFDRFECLFECNCK